MRNYANCWDTEPSYDGWPRVPWTPARSGPPDPGVYQHRDRDSYGLGGFRGRLFNRPGRIPVGLPGIVGGLGAGVCRRGVSGGPGTAGYSGRAPDDAGRRFLSASGADQSGHSKSRDRHGIRYGDSVSNHAVELDGAIDPRDHRNASVPRRNQPGGRMASGGGGDGTATGLAAVVFTIAPAPADLGGVVNPLEVESWSTALAAGSTVTYVVWQLISIV